ncbi:MAG: DUF805 domain-containing protein [Pseudomonadota bacterium]
MMGPKQAVTACFQDYAKFRGRARRPEFWWWMVFVALSQFCLGSFDDAFWPSPPQVGLSGMFFAFAYVPGIAVRFRRFQDVGYPGWLSLIPDVLGTAWFTIAALGLGGLYGAMLEFVYLASGALMIFACALPSRAGKNRYGEEPLRG